MESMQFGNDSDPPAPATGSRDVLGWLSLALALMTVGTFALAMVVGVGGAFAGAETKRAVNMAIGFIWFGGMFLALLGVVFGVLGMLGQGERRIHAMIGTVVCACLLLGSVGVMVIGLIAQIGKS
jgi:hypothetical protein